MKMNDILRQAQVMQSKIAKMQEEMETRTIDTSAGGGMVKVIMNGRHELQSVIIDPKIFEEGDAEMLQDLIVSAVNEGVRVSRDNLEREMANMSGGIKLPGMF